MVELSLVPLQLLDRLELGVGRAQEAEDGLVVASFVSGHVELELLEAVVAGEAVRTLVPFVRVALAISLFDELPPLVDPPLDTIFAVLLRLDP